MRPPLLILLVFFASLLLVPATLQSSKTETVGFHYKVISSVNHTWGYDIYRNNKVIIHQPCIPGIAGNQGFKKKSDAKKVAKLVIEKLNQGMMPPTITILELQNLKVL